MFEYFYGNETEQYIFFSVPQLLFTDDNFKHLSCESKLLYSFLLDRTALSRKNGWFESDGKIFVYFKQDELCERLNIGKDKAIKIFNELDTGKGIGLIERKKQGQGKPTKIFVKNFAKLIPEKVLTSENPKSKKNTVEVLTSENPKSKKNTVEVRNDTEVLTSENPKSELLKNRSLNVENSDVILYNHTNRTILSESYQSYRTVEVEKSKSKPTSESVKVDMIDKIEFDKTHQLVNQQIEYDYLISHYDKEQIDEISEIMTWCYCTPESSVRINGTMVDINLFREKLKSIDEMHIGYVLDCLAANTTSIKNRRNYLLTCLYNAPVTIDGYYASKVQHDLYGEYLNV